MVLESALPSPTGSALDAVWGSSSTDIWAVGRRQRGCGASIIHFDGSEWRGTTCIQTVTATSLSGTASDDVWATGGNEMLHFDGVEWKRLASGTEFELTDVHALSKTAAWAVGKGGAMVAWDGSSWKTFDSGTTENLQAVWAFAADDIWRAGTTGAAHYDGKSWSQPAWPNCRRFWGASTGELFCIASSVLYRWSGTQWTELGNSPVGDFRALWGLSTDHVMAVADSATYGYVQSHYELLDYENTPVDAVNALWGSEASGYVGVGERLAGGPIWTTTGLRPGIGEEIIWNSSIENADAAGGELGGENIFCAAAGDSGPVWVVMNHAPARLDGADLVPYAAGTAQPMNVIAVGPQGEVWAAGEQGAVTQLVGTTFQASSVGAAASLQAVWLDANGAPWVGGRGGRVFTRSGSSWTDKSLTTTNDVWALWGRGSNDVYAGGKGVFHYTGTWEDTHFPGGRVVTLWGNENELFAYEGDQPTGQVWRLAGGTWQSLSPTIVVSEGNPFVRGNELWVPTWNVPARISRWNGSRWDHFGLPDNDVDVTSAVAALANGEVMAFGPMEAIRQFTP